MKVLFLDNDGVICLANNWGSRVKKRKKDKISLVMNDWRLYGTLEELGDYYLSEGIIKKPIAFTKRYIGCDKPDEFEWFRQTMYEQQRCIEVRQYLTDHPEVTHWACIDDVELGERDTHDREQKWGLSNFVHTPRENEGIKQSGVKEKLLEYLT